MKNMMLHTGLSMLGQGPSAMPINFGTSLGQGLAQGVKAADVADKDYRDMAYQTFGIQNQMDERKYGREQDQLERDWRRTVHEYGLTKDKAEADRWERKFAADQQQGGGAYFGTPLPMNDANGQFMGYGLPSKDGSFKPLEPPPGARFASPYDKSYNTKLGAETAQSEVEKKSNFPKARAASAQLDMQWDLVNNTIDKAVQDLESGYLRTGLTGSMLGGMPGTPQYDLAQMLETIKANVGFDKLQSMRENSPTGGALGQVSDFENKLLQAVQGSLQQGQSPEQLKANLLTIKTLLAQTKAYKDSAFMRDYGSMLGASDGMQQMQQPMPQPNNSNADPLGIR
jgi:hypothetical protein